MSRAYHRLLSRRHEILSLENVLNVLNFWPSVLFFFFFVFQCFSSCMLYELHDSSVIETKQLSRFCAKSLRVPLHRTVNREYRVITTKKGKPLFVAHVTKNTWKVTKKKIKGNDRNKMKIDEKRFDVWEQRLVFGDSPNNITVSQRNQKRSRQNQIITKTCKVSKSVYHSFYAI